jgi:hypothetical protein
MNAEASSFLVFFDPGLMESQITGTLEALADYFSACGGAVFAAELFTEGEEP